MNFTLAELTRLKLEPGEVLAVKLYGDDYDVESTNDLQKKLQQLFPNNKVMMFVLPNGHDLQMEAVQAKLENKESKAVCGNPADYCSDCSCGKKEMLEAQDGTADEVSKPSRG